MDKFKLLVIKQIAFLCDMCDIMGVDTDEITADIVMRDIAEELMRENKLLGCSAVFTKSVPMRRDIIADMLVSVRHYFM